ncbi:Mitochondrial carrier domain protein [Raphanus sativus]|nr:Mitochondrial carrier domain protein [Raphanus sativus]
MIKLHYYPSSVSLFSCDSSSPPPSSPAFLSHTTGDDDSGDEIDDSGVESEIEKERWCLSPSVDLVGDLALVGVLPVLIPLAAHPLAFSLSIPLVGGSALFCVVSNQKTILKIPGFTDNVVTHILSGLGAGFFTVCIGSPADVVKSRMMRDHIVKLFIMVYR